MCCATLVMVGLHHDQCRTLRRVPRQLVYQVWYPSSGLYLVLTVQVLYTTWNLNELRRSGLISCIQIRISCFGASLGSTKFYEEECTKSECTSCVCIWKWAGYPGRLGLGNVVPRPPFAFGAVRSIEQRRIFNVLAIEKALVYGGLF